MSRLKSLFRRLRKSEPSHLEAEEDTQTAQKDDDRVTKPIKSTRGWRRGIAFFKLYFPLGMYQRGLEWSLEASSSSVSDENKPNNSDLKNKVIQIREKSFRTRFGYFCSRTILQSFGLAIVFTAPISLPWIFNVVIPFSIDLLPFGLSEIIREIIHRILVLLSPLGVIADIIMIASNFFATYNPILFYGTTLWILSELGFTDIEVFDVLENSENIETTSMMELLGHHYQSKFGLIQSVLAPLLIIIAASISFFLVIRSARKIIFEIQTEKEQTKNIEKTKRTLIGYYLDKGYSQTIYTENRVSSSSKMIWLARITKYGPIISVVLPIALAIGFVLI
ncbi:MAG: hypothetical protein JSW11_18285 [Candidatus Heimdallarchaeota archaeon]|nr:MAG: hypothetical protein JSW11_18285 [Candidatus Heimdallarchaeota archaeon]